MELPAHAVEMNSLKQQLEMALRARARWEGTANILAGEIKDLLGTADMYKRYESHALHWAWEKTNEHD
jgi:hypothetical protein